MSFRLSTLENSIKNLENTDDAISLKNDIELVLSKFNKLYLKFKNYNNQYFKGREFNKELDEIEGSLKTHTDKVLGSLNSETQDKNIKALEKCKKDDFYGMYAIEATNIFLSVLALIFLIINFKSGISFTHPFSLLLIALCVPVLTLLTTHQLPRLISGIISFSLIFYSLINLPTTQVINLTDSLRSSIQIPVTIYEDYECGEKCMKYTDMELIRLKKALNDEAVLIIKSRK
tara:strand:+ start:1953 stop:2648 length:696 start_codon:yes stop_codon:yes gene_type:complete